MEFAYNVLKDVEFVIPKHNALHALDRIILGWIITVYNVNLAQFLFVTAAGLISTDVLDAKMAIFFMTMDVIHVKFNLKYLDVLIVQVRTFV